MLIEHEAVVEVAAHRARGLELRVEREAALVRKKLARRRQQSHLDAARGFELAGDPCLRLAQEPALLVSLGQRRGQEPGEEHRRADRRRRHVDEIAGAEGRKPHRQEHGEHGREQRCRHPWAHRRHPEHEQRAGDKQQRRLEPGGAGRAAEVVAVVHLLDELRMHLDPGDALAERRHLVVE